jgi:hypothetical protein
VHVLCVCVLAMGIHVAYDVVVFTAQCVTEYVRCLGRATCGLFVTCMSDHVECVRCWVALPPGGCSVWYKKKNWTWSDRTPGSIILSCIRSTFLCTLYSFFSRPDEQSFKKPFNNWHQSRSWQEINHGEMPSLES